MRKALLLVAAVLAVPSTALAADPTAADWLAQARSEAAAGKYVAAHRHFGYYLAITDVDHDAVNAERTAAETHFASLVIQISGADAPAVTLDGAWISARTRSTNTVDPGHHVVRVEALGFPSVEEHIDVADGASGLVHVRMTRAPIVAEPVVFETEQPKREKRGGTQRTLGWTAIGLGAAVFAGGAITALANDGHLGSPDHIPQTTAVAGGILAATGLILLLTTPKDATTVGSR
jgi:hypothetical protein